MYKNKNKNKNNFPSIWNKCKVTSVLSLATCCEAKSLAFSCATALFVARSRMGDRL